jgi:site-specific recombinase XerD
MATAITRKLHRGHFAFMRAVIQGVDEQASWERYLQVEGEHSDVRNVRRTVHWIRDAFAAASKREAKPGTARLILLDAQRIAQAPAAPSLEDFARERGLEEFSEAEQVDAYQAEYPGQDGAGRASSRRGRLVQRQLDALRWLEELAAQNPKPGDGVGAWLNPAIANRLEAVGLGTLFLVAERINDLGARWWRGVPGVGCQKARRIMEWLQANESVLGLRIGAQALYALKQFPPAMRADVVPKATRLVPFEKLIVPGGLDGSEGRFRAPKEQCLMMAATDYDAIATWLEAKGATNAQGKESCTRRAYRKEAERLLLWAVLEQQKPVSSLSVEDAIAYREFLAAPPPAWCGPRHYQRWSSMWRPLEGPLSPVAQRHALTILRSLFDFLQTQNYVVGNPFAGIAKPSIGRRALGSSRTLTMAQWDFIVAKLELHATTEPGRRLSRAIRLLYATGLRLDEASRACLGDLEAVDFKSADGQTGTGWMLQVVGKGDRCRDVPVPAGLLQEIQEELEQHGCERSVKAVSNSQVKLLARFGTGEARPEAWSASGLYKAIVQFLQGISTELDAPGAESLKRASTHWLRHSHASHALQGREGREPVPIQIVQNNLGHASVGTTSGYLTTERDQRLSAMQSFWS